MTSQEKIKKLVKPDLYQVFLLGCFCRFPVSVAATHNWFVVNKKGKLDRWEILINKNCCGAESWDHLHKNGKPPFESFGFFATEAPSFWPTKLYGMVEGDENSLAKRMIDFIEQSPEKYPYNHTYFLTGHNSNTYIQWVLNHFPEFPGKLGWNAFGKRYKITT